MKEIQQNRKVEIKKENFRNKKPLMGLLVGMLLTTPLNMPPHLYFLGAPAGLAGVLVGMMATHLSSLSLQFFQLYFQACWLA